MYNYGYRFKHTKQDAPTARNARRLAEKNKKKKKKKNTILR
jgi:hypothetical protein